MTAKWDNGTYEITFSGISPKYLSPQPYKFKLKREPPGAAKPAFYRIVPDGNPTLPPGTPPNPFENCVLVLQPGRQPTLFLRDDEKLTGTPTAAAFQTVTDLIVQYVLEEDPYSYERLVGVIQNPDSTPTAPLPPVPVTFYKLERMHKTASKVLLLVQAVIAPGAANGSIAVMS